MALPHLTREEYLPLALILVTIFLSVVGQPHFPETLPVEWRAFGLVTKVIRTDVAMYLMPGFILAVYLWLLRLGHRDPLRKNILACWDAVYWLRASTVIFLLGLYIFVLGAGFGAWAPTVNAALTIGFSYVFYMYGRQLPRLKRNYSFGIITPWTLESNQTWRLTHLRAGQYFLVAAILNLSALFFTAWSFWVALLLLVVALVAARLYAWQAYHKESPHGAI